MTALLLTMLTQAPVVLSEPQVFGHSYRTPSWGTVALDFEVPPGTRILQVHFLQRLEGMKVEVSGGEVPGRSVPLFPERRLGGDTLNLEWSAEGVRYVTILLHHHVRGAPVVSGWAFGHRGVKQ